MKTINLFKHLLPSLQGGVGGRLLLLLCLIVAGVQSMWSWTNYHLSFEQNLTINGVTYELYSVQEYDAWIQDAEQLFGHYVSIIGSVGYNEFPTSNVSYYATVVDITATGEVVIPEIITNGGHSYIIKGISHLEQAVRTWEGTYRIYESGEGAQGPDYDKTTCYEYTIAETPVDISANDITKLTVNGKATFKGNFSAPSCTSVEFKDDVTFKGNFNAPSCTSVEFKKDVTFEANVSFPAATNIVFDNCAFIKSTATLVCSNVSELRFNYLSHEGKIQCNSLTDIYYQSNIPGYSGAASNYFTGVALNQVTAHVVNKTEEECATMHSTWAVYSEFDNIVPCDTPVQGHAVNFVLIAGMCDKGIEVWKNDELLGSISEEGGTFFEAIEDAIYLQLRVPSEYLKKITINGEDMTTSLSATTPDDPDYEGYMFYIMSGLSETSIVEVKYDYSLFATSSIRFESYNGTGSIDYSKIWFDNGRWETNHGGVTWEEKKTISKIEVTMRPDVDDFDWTQGHNTLGTLTNNGDGTYNYVLQGTDLTSSVIPIWFPTTDYGNVKTSVSSRNDIPLGYYFGEYVNAEREFMSNFDQTKEQFINTNVVVYHYDAWSSSQGGGYSTGIIYVQVPQGTTFRIVENGSDETSKCYWHNANELFSELQSVYNVDSYLQYTCPVDGYYYLLQDVEHDSYIIVDDGTTLLSEIESPFQIVQTITAYGDATLSLHKSNGDVVESVSNGESKTASMEKGANMQLVVTLPANASAANYEAHLIIDGIDNILTTMTGDGGVLTFQAFDMENVTSSHNITLITRQTGGLAATDVIEFADANVKAICVAATTGWDTNGDGELSKAEAAAVTSLKVDGAENTVFYNNTTITSFDEFQYFTGIETIESKAFYNCQSLKSIVLPNSITQIMSNGFYNCKELEFVDLPENLLSISDLAFAYTKLKTIFIPKNVTTIQTRAFMSCNSLQTIAVDEENTKFKAGVGYNVIVESGTTVKVGSKYSQIPEGVTGISMYAFNGLTGLTTITIPSTVTSVGLSSFAGCTNLKSVVSKNENPPTMGNNAFSSINANCVLTVPYGTKGAYIGAGWTTDIFKGGIVEDMSQYDVNNDSQVNIADVTKLVNKVVGKE